MRFRRPLVILAVLGLLAPATGCSTQITGTPRASSVAVPLGVTEDGFGIVAGFENAPARIEIFTEPQCSHCGDLQRTHGDEIAYLVGVGGLEVTYRPLTFLDVSRDGQVAGYSARVVNAMFLATEAVGNSAATGVQFQRFVEQLWVNQDPGGEPFSGEELRAMAADAGMADLVADHIADDAGAVELPELEDTNFTLLIDVDPVETGTPTVYDLNAEEKVDLTDQDWLQNLAP